MKRCGGISRVGGSLSSPARHVTSIATWRSHRAGLLRSGQAAGGGNGNSRQRRGRDGNSRRQGDTPRTCDQRWSCCEGCHPIYTGSQSSAEVHIPTISSRIPSSRGHSCGPKLCTGLDLRWLHWHLTAARQKQTCVLLILPALSSASLAMSGRLSSSPSSCPGPRKQILLTTTPLVPFPLHSQVSNLIFSFGLKRDALGESLSLPTHRHKTPMPFDITKRYRVLLSLTCQRGILRQASPR